MKKFLQKKYIDIVDENLDVKGFFEEVISEIEEWPKIERENIYSDDYDDDSDQEDYHEPLDIENFSVVELKENFVLICAGGDWQEPQQVKITLHNGEPIAEIVDEGWNSGMSDSEFLKDLFDIELESDDTEEIVEIIKNLK